MPFIKRPPRAEELPWLAEQLGAAYGETHRQDIGAGADETEIAVDLAVRQPVLAYAGSGPALVLVAEDADTGALGGAVLHMHAAALRSVQAVLMWVHPDYRGRLPVRQLMRDGEDLARRTGATRLDAGVVTNNPHLQRVYERWGFKPFAHLMSKQL
jgi:GNAT superfamily N-acetyltransferase